MMLPILSRYVKCSDGTKQMSVFIKDEELLNMYNKIWDIINLMEKII